MAETIYSPTSVPVAEMEELINKLYLPGSPAEVSKIQETLQSMQRSPEGWQMADRLLQSEDKQARFFGALTFTVKLNTDWETLDDEGRQEVLQRLLDHFVRLTFEDDAPLVLKKLCSALVMFFLRFPLVWSQCVMDVLLLVCKEWIPPAERDDDLLQMMDDLTMWVEHWQLEIVLWFCSTLAEEVGKTDAESINHREYREVMTINVRVVARLLDRALRCTATRFICKGAYSLVNEAIKCYQSWVFDCQRIATGEWQEMFQACGLTDLVLSHITKEETYETSVDFFSDVLANRPQFLTVSEYVSIGKLFRQQWAREWMEKLKNGDFDFHSLQFGRFVLAYGDAMLKTLVMEPDAPESVDFMALAHELLTCKGLPVAEDEICMPALEFWLAYMEYAVDHLPTLDGNVLGAVRVASSHAAQAVQECWQKMQFPNSFEGVSTWDAETRRGFREFRKDAADLLLSAFSLMGPMLLQNLVDLAFDGMGTGRWGDFEATLFCITKLHDPFLEHFKENGRLEGLLASERFILTIASMSYLPGRVNHALVDLFANYAPFFERHPQHLAPPMRFLIECLNDPSLASDASKAIASLCSTCRQVLVHELDGFIQLFASIHGAPALDSPAKNRLLGAIASIIQAVDSEEGQARQLQILLGIVELDVQACLTHVAEGSMAEAEDSGVTALQCLTSIGKGMQAPEDIPIDLESEVFPSTFWHQGPGAVIQKQIVGFVEQVCDALPQSGAVIEAACGVYKSGFTERTGGPFFFSSQVTTRFLLRGHIYTPRLGLILGTACALVNSHSTESSTRIDEEARALLVKIMILVHQLRDPGHDPEIAQNCVDLLFRLAHRYLNVIVQFPPPEALGRLFIFTVKCLASREILPKRCAAQLWAHLLNLHNKPEPIQSALDNIIDHFGPMVAETLIINIGGNASRSELDSLVEPLKKMIFRQRHARTWLEQALFKETFPSDKVDDETKRMFLQKILALRGAKGTKQIVKDFWIACRGMVFGYTS
ncbi:MAG: hypothetical protein M1823_005545 [Watsoniomyces obsoletus]|nr:MAG: hypothetical protein M1823_005545 [Watsoniomyces obsoletus]